MLKTDVAYTASPVQSRLWQLMHIHGNEPFRIVCRIVVEGALAVEKLRAASVAAQSRYEILRTTCRLTTTGVVQIVHPETQPVEEIVKIECDTVAAAQPLLEQQGFQVRVRNNAERSEILLLLSSLCADAESAVMLARSMTAPHKDDTAIQYADIADVLSQMLSDPVGQEYWGKHGSPDIVEARLPFEQKGSPHGIFRLKRHKVMLEPGIVGAVTELGVKSGSVSLLLAAAWQVLLWRFGCPAVIGWSFSARESEELRQSIGPFTRYLPARGTLGPAMRFADVLRALRAWKEEASLWQECFDWSGMDEGESGYFPFSFDYQELPGGWSNGETRFSVEELYSCIDRCKVRLNSTKKQDRLELEFDWDPNFYSEQDIERLAGSYVTLLDAAVRHPQCRLEMLPLLDRAEWRRVTGEFNATRVERDATRLLHELFEVQARGTPNAEAVTFGTRSWTYAELDSRANRLARLLQANGARPELLVGVCMERSLELVAVLLAVMKAGGAYVPIDPDYPPERLNYMIEASSPCLVLTQRHLLSRLSNAKVLVIEEVWPEAELLSSDALNVAIHPENAIYAIYTSGSTGKPKAVVNRHGSLVNRIQWMQSAYRLAAADRVLQKTPYSFDVSVWEFFWPLTCGACLVMADPGGHRDPSYIVDTIIHQRITVLHFVPSMMDIFLQTDGAENCSSLRLVICSGEALPLETHDRFFQVLPSISLQNLYGPTEAAIDVTYHSCGPNQEKNSIPIGKPVDNTEIYIVDRQMKPVPMYLPGQLCIAGANLARGYLRRPELTAQAFVPNPFGEAGSRLYLTGDLASYRPDGSIEYLGRMDNQVKIRGVRIELGEIEAVMLSCPGVKQAVALVNGRSERDRRIVAYIVPADAGSFSPSDFLGLLRTKLPEQMVPHTVLSMRQMPLSANGKIDRGALPPAETVLHASKQITAPRTDVEVCLANVWQDVLGVPSVSVHDGFFDLGGHSILAPQMVSSVRKTLGVDVALCHLFAGTTVADVAAQVETALRLGQGWKMRQIERIERSNRPLLSVSQEAWLSNASDARRNWNSSISLRLQGSVDTSALAAALHRVATRHESLRTTIAGHSLCIVPEIDFRAEVHDLTTLPAADRARECSRLIRSESTRVFDLSALPLVKVLVIRSEPDEYIVGIIAQPLVCDRSSLNVLLHDIAVCYEALVRDDIPHLPDLPVQYADFAHWQRAWLLTSRGTEALGYWRTLLDGCPVPGEMAPSRRRNVTTFSSTYLVFWLPQKLTRALEALASLEGTTLFVPMLGAFQLMHAALCERKTVTTGVRLGGRGPWSETRLITGFFENTLPFRLDLTEELSFRKIIDVIRGRALKAYGLQVIPWLSVAKQVYPGCNASDLSFPVAFSFDEEPGRRVTLEGMRIDLQQPIDGVSSDCELNMDVIVAQEGVRAILSFDSAVFSHNDGQKFLETFFRLLQEVTAQPDVPIRRIFQQAEIAPAGAVMGVG